jgi:hypothetical protein
VPTAGQTVTTVEPSSSPDQVGVVPGQPSAVPSESTTDAPTPGPIDEIDFVGDLGPNLPLVLGVVILLGWLVSIVIGRRRSSKAGQLR